MVFRYSIIIAVRSLESEKKHVSSPGLACIIFVMSIGYNTNSSAVIPTSTNLGRLSVIKLISTYDLYFKLLLFMFILASFSYVGYL